MSKATACLLIPGGIIMFMAAGAEGAGWLAFGFMLAGLGLAVEFVARGKDHERIKALEAAVERLQREGTARSNASDRAEARQAASTKSNAPSEAAKTSPTSEPSGSVVAPPPAPPPRLVEMPAAPVAAPAAPAFLAKPAVSAATVAIAPAVEQVKPSAPVASPPAHRSKPDALSAPPAGQSAPPVAAQPTKATAPIPALVTAVQVPGPAEKRAAEALATPPAARDIEPAAARQAAPPVVARTSAREPGAEEARHAAVPPPPAPRAEKAPPRTSLLDLEQLLGVNWLAKIGVAILVVGLSFFLAWQLSQLGPMGKDLVGFAVAIALVVLGAWGEKKERYRIIARAVIAGGWALMFFVGYATHHVPAARVIDSAAGAVVLMSVVSAAIVVHTLRYRSQLVTGFAFALAFATVALNRADVSSLTANVVLAVGFSIVVLRMRWFRLEVLGIVATYANHALWLAPIVLPMAGSLRSFPQLTASTSVLVLYWAVFRASFVLRRPPDDRTSALAGMVNTAGLLTLIKLQAPTSGLLFWLLLAIGAAELALARLPVMRERRHSFVVLTTIGAALIGAAIPFRFAPGSVTAAWLVDATVFLAVGIATSERVYRRLGSAIAAATAVQFLTFPALRLASARFEHGGADHEWGAGALAIAVATLLFVDGAVLPRRWPDLYPRESDTIGARWLGYGACVLAVFAGWALFPGVGAAVFWAALALVLFAIDRRIERRNPDLVIQSALVALAAIGRAAFYNLESQEIVAAAPIVTWRFVTICAVGAVLYALSFGARRESAGARGFCCVVPSWSATTLLMLLTMREVEPLYTPLVSAAFIFLLAFAAMKIDRMQLLPQAFAAGAVAVVQLFASSLPSAEAAFDGFVILRWRAVALVLVAAALFLLARWRAADPITAPAGFRVIGLWTGTTLVALLAWYELRPEAVVFAWAVLTAVLAHLGRRHDSGDFALQANFLAAVAACAVVSINVPSDALLIAAIHLTWRLAACVAVVAALYFLSHENAHGPLGDDRAWEIAPSWAAAGLLVILLSHELPPNGVVLGWVALALAFAIAGDRLRIVQLTAQANAVAGLALMSVTIVELSISTLGEAPPPMAWRVAGGAGVTLLLYSLTRWNARTFSGSFLVIEIPRALGTAVLMLLAWRELQVPIVIVGWCVIAAVLVTVAVRYRITALLLHANAIAAVAIARAVVVNLPSSEIAYPPLSWRVAGAGALVALLYALAHWTPDGVHELAIRVENRQDAASAAAAAPRWAAAGLLVLLAWYELLPASVSVAWALIAVVLLEIGLRRGSGDLVNQALLILTMAAGRLFVVNLNIDDAGRFGPRAYTILAIVAALLHAWHRLDTADEQTGMRRWSSAGLASSAVVAFAALVRVELSPDLVVVGWSGLALALLAAAALSASRIFLYNGLVLAAAALARGAIHNLYERSYFPSAGPFDRWIHLGAAAALLLASLPFAFKLRRVDDPSDRGGLTRAASWVFRRPEQLLFFIPLSMIAAVIATEMSRGMLTIAFGVLAVATIVFAIVVHERTFRLAGVALLLVCIGKVLVVDFWTLTLRDKSLTGIVMGLALIGVSLLYSRKRESILEFL